MTPPINQTDDQEELEDIRVLAAELEHMRQLDRQEELEEEERQKELRKLNAELEELERLNAIAEKKLKEEFPAFNEVCKQNVILREYLRLSDNLLNKDWNDPTIAGQIAYLDAQDAYNSFVIEHDLDV